MPAPVPALLTRVKQEAERIMWNRPSGPSKLRLNVRCKADGTEEILAISGMSCSATIEDLLSEVRKRVRRVAGWKLEDVFNEHGGRFDPRDRLDDVVVCDGETLIAASLGALQVPAYEEDAEVKDEADAEEELDGRPRDGEVASILQSFDAGADEEEQLSVREGDLVIPQEGGFHGNGWIYVEIRRSSRRNKSNRGYVPDWAFKPTEDEDSHRHDGREGRAASMKEPRRQHNVCRDREDKLPRDREERDNRCDRDRRGASGAVKTIAGRAAMYVDQITLVRRDGEKIVHGEDGGSEQPEEHLNANEAILAVEQVTHGHYLGASLAFETSQQNRIIRVEGWVQPGKKWRRNRFEAQQGCQIVNLCFEGPELVDIEESSFGSRRAQEPETRTKRAADADHEPPRSSKSSRRDDHHGAEIPPPDYDRARRSSDSSRRGRDYRH